MGGTIPYISINELKDDEFVNNILYPDLSTTYYWSDDFSSELYIEAAGRGLITTSNNYEEYGDILLPEMQDSYAVLYHNDLHISRKVRKLLKSEYKLEVGVDLDILIYSLKKYHKEECWLTDSYVKLLYKLKKCSLEADNFKLITTLLYCGNDVASGELGYCIGKTYTSLTGFYNKKYSNWGTLQLVLLSGYLKDKKISFWNMGHPYMEYKKKLGAKILSRKKFLDIWLTESASCQYM